MTDVLIFLAVIALLVVLVPAIQFLSIFFTLLRWPVWDEVYTRTEAPPELLPLHAAAKAEVEGLGFVCVASLTLRNGPDTYQQFVFRHESWRAFAWLNLMPGLPCGYPLSFSSFLADGRLLTTLNRLAWAKQLDELPEVEVEDPCTDSPELHWAAHVARIQDAALATLSDDEAIDRLLALGEKALKARRDRGQVVPAGDGMALSVNWAFQMTRSGFRVRRMLVRPFMSVVHSDAHRAAFHAEQHAYQKRMLALQPQRPAVRRWLFAVSMLAFFGLWGLVFGWRQALMVVGVIAVHESGHAVAMWAFGHRDLKIFFVPFLGAAVTAPEVPMAVWKRAIIYLAGPLPGLIAAIAALIWLAHNPDVQWAAALRELAWISFGVNLFNLLPVTPLDGGRLLEIALLEQHPRVRFGFAMASLLGFIALALWIGDPLMWGVVGFLLMGVGSQWRTMKLRQRLAQSPGAERSTEQLFREADALAPGKGFAVHWQLVKAAESHRQTVPARRWEMLAAPVLLVAIWAGSLMIALPEFFSARNMVAEPATAEEAFDRAYENDFEYDEETSQRLAKLAALAAKLSPQDSRRIDLFWMEAESGDGPARLTRMLEIISLKQAGHFTSRKLMVSQYLQSVHATYLDEPAAKRLTLLQDAVDAVLKQAPDLFVSTIDGQLRVAEAMDAAGDEAGAEARLQQIRKDAETREDCKCEAPTVLRAQAWFHMSHDRNAEALKLLEESAYNDRFKKPGNSLAETRAWALLMNDRDDEGLAQMRIAAYTSGYEPTAEAKAKGAQPSPPYLTSPGALAFALKRAGRESEARQLLTSREGSWECHRRRYSDATSIDPWESMREEMLSQTTQSLCPAERPEGRGRT